MRAHPLLVLPAVASAISFCTSALAQVVSLSPPSQVLSDDQMKMRDLVAQEAMAEWAYWMTVLTAITTVIGIVSVIFIFRSFKQTSDALKEARLTNVQAKETAFLENRPWILVNGPSFEASIADTSPDEITLRLFGRFNIKNIGKLPAIGVVYDIVLSQEQDVIDGNWKMSPVDNARGGSIILPTGIDNEFVVDNYFVKVRRTPGDKKDVRLIQVLLRVSYQDQTQPLRRLLSVGHGILAENAPGGPASFQPLIFEKIVSKGLGRTMIYAYSIKYMI